MRDRLVLSQLSLVVTELGSTLRSIGRSGGRFISLEDKIDTAEAAGRKAANVIVSVSGWEHQRLGERTRKGLAAARAKGGSISRPSVQDVPRLKEYIAEMRAEGMTLQAIADTLNEKGVPTPRRAAVASLERPGGRRLPEAEAMTPLPREPRSPPPRGRVAADEATGRWGLAATRLPRTGSTSTSSRTC